MTNFTQKSSPFFKTALMVCALSTVVGCSARLTDDPKSHDPRLQHPIQVAREQVSVTVALPEQDSALAPDDQRRLRAFIRDFVGRGRGTVMIESFLGERARDILMAQGLRANEIVIAPETTIEAPNAVMTFSANVAQVPNCGDWSKTYSFNPTNNPQPDFGCSNRRNLGLTVADPGDLIDAQPMSGHGAARRDKALDSYNSGAPIGPQTTTTSTTAVSGVK